MCRHFLREFGMDPEHHFLLVIYWYNFIIIFIIFIKIIFIFLIDTVREGLFGTFSICPPFATASSQAEVDLLDKKKCFE